MFSYVYFGKLTEGAKNMLQGYMIEYSQDLTKSTDKKMGEIFCGIFSNIKKRKKDIIHKAIVSSTKHQEIKGIYENIYSYLENKNT